MAACLAAGLAGGLAGASAPASAQEWWENFPGFKSQESPRPAVNDERRRQDQLNDLRTDRLPMRSQEMIEALDAAVQRYQAIVSNGGWPVIPGTRTIGPRTTTSAWRILLPPSVPMSGELKRRPTKTLFGTDYSEDLEGAMRRFQEDNGLRVTGRADRPTLQALNIPAHARLAQLRTNQQRLRDLLSVHRGDDRYVLVNAAAFQLEAVEQARGRAAPPRHRRQARAADADRARHHPRAQLLPVLAGAGERGDAGPHSAPDQGARVPAAGAHSRADGVLQRHRDRRLLRSTGARQDARELRFRQDPGPQNALGLVRIDMPNAEGVYMHDTPLKQLFNQRGRAFSAGCVRVQDVFTLVEWIAKYENGWDEPGRTQDVIATGQALDMNLTRPLPVYFTYITAWAELDGRILFRPDIYNRDGVRDLVASDRARSGGWSGAALDAGALIAGCGRSGSESVPRRSRATASGRRGSDSGRAISGGTSRW